MTNPIPTSGLWHTPDSMDQLYDMVSEYTGEQKALAMHIMMLTLNACHKLVDDQAIGQYNTDTN